VNISSIAARTSPPGSGYYAASKAALARIPKLGSFRADR